jgi:hypothetical protein
MPSERFRLFPTVSLPTRITGRRTPPRQYPPSGFKLPETPKQTSKYLISFALRWQFAYGMRRYRPATMPHTVATERKTMPNTRSPTGWYYCSYLLRLTLAGSPSAQDPEARFLSYENTVLIRADSSLEAYDKTLRIARENETSYTNEHQQDVQWKLVGITDILPIYEALGDGAEIAFTPRPPRKLKNLQKWVLPRERFAES